MTKSWPCRLPIPLSRGESLSSAQPTAGVGSEVVLKQAQETDPSRMRTPLDRSDDASKLSELISKKRCY